MQNLMNKSDRNGSFTNRGGDAFDVTAAHVSNRKDARPVCLEQIRRPRQRPFGRTQVIGRQVRTSLDESAPIECDATIEPGRVGYRARHHEYMSDVASLNDARTMVAPLDAIEMLLSV